MKYCVNCGKQLEDNVGFCPDCGTKTTYPNPPGGNTAKGAARPYTPWGKPVMSEKSGAVAILLSLLIVGLGTVYAGRGVRGLGWFLGWLLLLVFFLPAIVAVGIVTNPLLIILAPFIFIVYYIAAAYDAYKSCCIINELWAEYLGY